MLNALVIPAIVVAAFLIAVAVLIALGAFDRWREQRLSRTGNGASDSAVFLFDGETLVDATPAARKLLAGAPRASSPWQGLANLLRSDFPGFAEQMQELAEVGTLVMDARDGTSRITAEWQGDLARLTFAKRDPDDTAVRIDDHSFIAMSHELETMRAGVDGMPYPLWQETPDGTITWCNEAYLDLADGTQTTGETPSWPPPAIFTTCRPVASTDTTAEVPHRLAVDLPGQSTRRWFDVSARRLDNGDKVFTAIPVDRLVRAETTLSEFVATLTKTFASLPIGVAIFDRSRELAVFNPALVDLTVLKTEFLISKPTLSAFLDRLREARMMPEPKDYRSWRQQIFDLEAAAQNGTFEEIWSLPSGQTYRVIGRPHPDGAVALLFEDISDETSVTRRFRDELDTGQAVLDALPQGVAVFTATGVLSISNRGYSDIWGNDPSTSLGDITLADAIDRWRAQSAPSPVWDRLQGFTVSAGPREPWSAWIVLRNGQSIEVQVTPLARGAVMVGFHPTRAEHASAKPAPTASDGLQWTAALDA